MADSAGHKYKKHSAYPIGPKAKKRRVTKADQDDMSLVLVIVFGGIAITLLFSQVIFKGANNRVGKRGPSGDRGAEGDGKPPPENPPVQPASHALQVTEPSQVVFVVVSRDAETHGNHVHDVFWGAFSSLEEAFDYKRKVAREPDASGIIVEIISVPAYDTAPLQVIRPTNERYGTVFKGTVRHP